MAPARGWFYPGMAMACLLTVAIGFGPSYYLRPADAPPLPLLTHIHGVVFTAWILMFLAQVSLVAAGWRDRHRVLGVAGAVLAIGMVVLGVVVALASARRGVAAGQAREALGFLIVPLGDILSFAVLAGCGIAYRTRTDLHRRLMLMATIATLPAAIGRMPGLDQPGPFSVYFLALLAAAPIRDRLAGRRPHPVSLWGGIAVYVSELGRFMAQQSPVWLAIAERLV